MVSASNVWAVGSYRATADGPAAALIEHFDGHRWRVVQTPDVPGDTSGLFAVAASGPSEYWAVGLFSVSQSTQSLILHYDGSSWGVITPPIPGTDYLTSVVAVSPTDVWAVGNYHPSGEYPLTLHYDGADWALVPAPQPGYAGDLFGIAASGSTDVWSVGIQWGQEAGQTLVLHWDGAAWVQAESAAPPFSSSLQSVAQKPYVGWWAVGWHGDPGSGAPKPLIESYDGEGWYQVPLSASPDVSGLEGVTSSSGRIWAVGHAGTHSLIEQVCPVRVTDSQIFPSEVGSRRGAAVIWSMPSSNRHPHSVADASGMALFDSGPMTPGATFAFVFFAAGIYSVADSSTGRTGLIRVPLSIAPRSGRQKSKFTIVWSASAAPPGYVFDVQVKRPRSKRFVCWRCSSTETRGTFVPDAGPGSYEFRGRLRNSMGKSGWSRATVMRVTQE